MTNKYPYGYGNVSLTWEQMATKSTVKNLHPEFQRRFKALIEFAATKNVPLGVGTGWRVQPNPPPPGFAKPGNSWHESCPVDPVSCTAFAIDTVPKTSWPWMENNIKAYGMKTFKYVNNEPWHIQPIETPNGRKYARTPPPIGHFVLPGEDTDSEDEDMLFDGFWKREQNDAVYAIYKDGTKQWMIDPPHFDGMVNLQKMNGASSEALSVRTCEDPGMFAAMGLVVGPIPAGCDNWGNPV